MTFARVRVLAPLVLVMMASQLPLSKQVIDDRKRESKPNDEFGMMLRGICDTQNVQLLRKPRTKFPVHITLMSEIQCVCHVYVQPTVCCK